MAATDVGLRVAKVAFDEWWFFGSQYRDGETPDFPVQQAAEGHGVGGDENNPGFKQRVWTYFKIGVFPDTNGWVQHKDALWSAAFVSYCMRVAGAGAAFPYSIRHSDYVSEAVRNRIKNKKQNRVVAYAKTEITPDIGDVLWHGVDGTANWTYADLKRHVENNGGSFSSHCDIVLSVDRPTGTLLVVGGNVRDTVLRQKIAISSDGKLGQTKYAAVVKNNIRACPQSALLAWADRLMRRG